MPVLGHYCSRSAPLGGRVDPSHDRGVRERPVDVVARPVRAPAVQIDGRAHVHRKVERGRGSRRRAGTGVVRHDIVEPDSESPAAVADDRYDDGLIQRDANRPDAAIRGGRCAGAGIARIDHERRGRVPWREMNRAQKGSAAADGGGDRLRTGGGLMMRRRICNQRSNIVAHYEARCGGR